MNKTIQDSYNEVIDTLIEFFNTEVKLITNNRFFVKKDIRHKRDSLLLVYPVIIDKIIDVSKVMFFINLDTVNYSYLTIETLSGMSVSHLFKFDITVIDSSLLIKNINFIKDFILGYIKSDSFKECYSNCVTCSELLLKNYESELKDKK